VTRATTNGALKALAIAPFFVFGGCGEPAPTLREWQPSDHQPPPAVTPEGQGAGEEPSAGDEDGAASQARAASALWGMRCASCHGVGGRGDGGDRPPGASLPDMTSEAFHAAHDDAQLTTVITQGKGLMPAFRSELTEQGIQALVAHIRSLRPRGQAPAP